MKCYKELSGKWKLRERFFGGYDVLVQEIEHPSNVPVKKWRKAKFVDILNLTVLEKFKTDEGI